MTLVPTIDLCQRADASSCLRIPGYDGQRGAPRGGIGSYNAPQNHAPANLPSPGSSMSSGMDSPAGEKFSLFASGIPPNVSDNRLHEIFEVCPSHYP